MKDSSMWIYKEYMDLLEDMDTPIETVVPKIPEKKSDSLFCKCDNPKKVRSEAMREPFWYCKCCKKEWRDLG